MVPSKEKIMEIFISVIIILGCLAGMVFMWASLHTCYNPDLLIDIKKELNNPNIFGKEEE